MLARRLLAGALALPVAVLATALAPTVSPASAAIPWTPCPTAGYECAKVDVPLDRGGGLPGTVALNVTRVPSATNPRNDAVLALAGGPGQAAVPLAPNFATILKPAIADRDLLVFDQRGTGDSGALDCTSLHGTATLLKAASQCAAQLGPARGLYRTADSVEDIEALRIAGGYDKLVLYGVSYGTKVALAYAAAHPAQVESLVLDSVVLPEGPDPFQRSTLSGSTRMLRDLCADTACRAATTNAAGDLSRLAAKLRRGALRGKVVTTSGRSESLSLTQNGLLDILLAGDLNPTLRAELPGSMRAALEGDAQPILRLSVRSEGLTTGLQSAGTGSSDALFLATTCEEQPFPWVREAGVNERAIEATVAAQQIPRAQLGPFSPKAALQGGPIPYCLGWPDASPAPAAPSALPTVPTLVLDGALDLRTPYEDAAQIPSRIPGALVVKVPNTGHSVLGSEEAGCAANALAAFFADGSAPPCTSSANPFPPTPLPPRTFKRIKADGPTRRTVIAARSTIRDALYQIIGDAFALGKLPRRVAGLRGGKATVSSTTFRLSAYEYVPGVKVSGPANVDGNATVTVRGGGALSGTLHFASGGAVTGRLGGRRVNLASSAAVRGSGLPSLSSVLKRPRLGP